MLIPVCSACPGARVIGEIIHDCYVGEVRFTHGMCRFHELHSLIKGDIANQREKAEYKELLKHKKPYLTFLDKIDFVAVGKLAERQQNEQNHG